MGYVHDTSMSLFVGPEQAQYTVGTFSDTVASNVWFKRKTAADNTSVIKIPVPLLQSATELEGSKLASIDIWFKVATAALQACSAAIYKAVLPADGAAYAAPAAQSFSYDAGHDAAGERIDVDEHRMTLTLDTPVWLDNDDEVYVELTVDAAATSVFDYYGSRINYTLRL